jgi:uncharacterized membrane protein
METLWLHMGDRWNLPNWGIFVGGAPGDKATGVDDGLNPVVVPIRSPGLHGRDHGVPNPTSRGAGENAARQSFTRALPFESSAPARRFDSIDILRALAVLLMVPDHFVENLSDRVSSWPALDHWITDVVGSVCAPLFTLLSGLSLSFWVMNQRRLGKSERAIDKACVRRGLLVFGLGLAFAFFVWLPRYLFDWDILTLIGAATLVLAAARRLSPRVLIGLSIAAVAVSPWLRQWTGYDGHWGNHGEYVYDLTIDQITLGFFVHGYFPFFPWIAFPLAGYALGEILQEDESGELWPPELAIVGGGLMAAAALGEGTWSLARGHWTEAYAGRATFYPASTVFVLGMAGLTLVSLSVLHRFVDHLQRAPWRAGGVLTFFRRYSYFSLTVYIVHHVVHVWPIWIYAAVTGEADSQRYLGTVMDTPAALGLSAIFVAVFYLVLVLLDRHKKYSLEWVLRWLSD